MRTLTYIGRCKACKRVERVEVTLVRDRSWKGDWGRSVRQVVLEAWGKRYTQDNSENLFVPCGCTPNRYLHLKRLHGRVSTEPCGAKCLSATGPNCECSCGGKNHGANHAH